MKAHLLVQILINRKVKVSVLSLILTSLILYSSEKKCYSFENRFVKFLGCIASGSQNTSYPASLF